jgi:peroxiredoxin family protein
MFSIFKKKSQAEKHIEDREFNESETQRIESKKLMRENRNKLNEFLDELKQKEQVHHG